MLVLHFISTLLTLLICKSFLPINGINPICFVCPRIGEHRRLPARERARALLPAALLLTPRAHQCARLRGDDAAARAALAPHA